MIVISQFQPHAHGEMCERDSTANLVHQKVAGRTVWKVYDWCIDCGKIDMIATHI